MKNAECFGRSNMKYLLILVFILGGCVSWEPPIKSGEEFKLGGTLTCCSCGLVHNLTYRVEGNDCYVKMWQNEWLTAERRKYMQSKIDVDSKGLVIKDIEEYIPKRKLMELALKIERMRTNPFPINVDNIYWMIEYIENPNDSYFDWFGEDPCEPNELIFDVGVNFPDAIATLETTGTYTFPRPEYKISLYDDRIVIWRDVNE